MATSDTVELREIPGYRAKYNMAGSDGYVYSMVSGAPIKLAGAFDGKKRYLHVWGYPIDGNRKTINVHVLVCSAFHGDRPSPQHTVSHLNGNRLDNRAENLDWELHVDNIGRKFDHGTDDRGHKNSRSCVTPEQVREIRTLLSSKEKQQTIADKFGVSRTTISRIANGHRFD